MKTEFKNARKQMATWTPAAHHLLRQHLLLMNDMSKKLKHFGWYPVKL